nr:unnamed protein product [Callosobruchus analis]
MQERQSGNASEHVHALWKEKLKIHVSQEHLENCFWTRKSKNRMDAILFIDDPCNLKVKLLPNRKLLKGLGLTLTKSEGDVNNLS